MSRTWADDLGALVYAALMVGLVVVVYGDGAHRAAVWEWPRVAFLFAMFVVNLAVIAPRLRGVHVEGWVTAALTAWAVWLLIATAATIGAAEPWSSLVGGMGTGLLYWMVLAAFLASAVLVERSGVASAARGQRWGFLVGVVVVALLVVAQMLGAGDGAAFVQLAKGQTPNATFSHGGHASVVLALGAIYVAVEFVAGRLIARWAWPAYALICAALWLASTRTSVLAMAVGLVVLAWETRQWRRVVTLAVVAVVAFGVSHGVTGFGHEGRAVEQLVPDRTMSGRTRLWGEALQLIEERPNRGWGFGGYAHAGMEAGELVIVKAHNVFLDVWVEVGWPGLLAWVTMWLVAVRATPGPWRAVAVVYGVWCVLWYESAEFAHLAWWAVLVAPGHMWTLGWNDGIRESARQSNGAPGRRDLPADALRANGATNGGPPGTADVAAATMPGMSKATGRARGGLAQG